MYKRQDEQDGTMAAILGLEDDQVDIACQKTAGNAWIANYNAPGQVVIAGSPDDLDRARDTAKELGAKRAMRLSVGGAFHSPLMAPARDRLRKAIDQVEFRAAEQAVYCNVDAMAHTDSADFPDLLGAQLTSPVRWRQTLRALETDGFTTFVELGPGTVLTGLVKRAVKTAGRCSVQTPAEIDSLLETLAGAKETDTAADAAATPVLEGEHLFATERMVVSPAAGIFSLGDGCAEGQRIGIGQVLGTVNGQDVVSSFEGQIMGVLAYDGERVTSRQPIAWLRTSS